jgi:hypothetical protein
MVYKGFTLVGELGLAPTLFKRKRASTCYSLRIYKARERTDTPLYQGEKINFSYLMAIHTPPPLQKGRLQGAYKYMGSAAPRDRLGTDLKTDAAFFVPKR